MPTTLLIVAAVAILIILLATASYKVMHRRYIDADSLARIFR